MKQVLILAMVICCAFTRPELANTNCDPDKSSATLEYVYICNSENAKVFHAVENCRGLKHCKHETLKVTKSDAENRYNRRKCKEC